MHNKSQNFIEKIVEKKREDLSHKNGKTQSFLNVFTKNNKEIGLIAEVKFASPTKPHLGSPDELLQRVKQYEKSGADAISVITEPHFFKGDVLFVSQVKKHVTIPVLQKDFVIDPYQIYEAKRIGSDALLLIARLIDVEKLKEFVELCFTLDIEPVVEINSEEDLQKASVTSSNIIAVNARDLETFVIDISKACSLVKKIPDRYVKLGFSGINSVKEISLYKEAGAKGVLVGTSLMQAKDITNFIGDLKV